MTQLNSNPTPASAPFPAQYNTDIYRRLLPALLFHLITLTEFCQAQAANPIFTRSFSVFNETFTIHIVGGTTVRNNTLADQIRQELLFRQRAWHSWKSGPLARINKLLPNKVWFSYAPSIRDILLTARSLAIKSNHYFNPALGELTRLWEFHRPKKSTGKPPADHLIRNLMHNAPRMDHLDIQGIRIKSRHTALQLDLGRIMKGYATDFAIDFLRHHGVKHAMIKAGPNYKVIGRQNDRPWQIRLRTTTLTLQDQEAVFTLNNKLQHYKYNNRYFHAVLDPHSGYPVTHTQSVTIIHPQATVADAASAALFAAGPENWQLIAKRLQIKYVLLVDSNGKVHLSRAMRKRLALATNH